jgi:hypothetical protein
MINSILVTDKLKNIQTTIIYRWTSLLGKLWVKGVKMKVMLDREWINLILQAKQLGLSLEEIKQFLNERKDLKKVGI